MIDRGARRTPRLGLYRRTRLISGPQGPRVLLDGRQVVLLCSNNYLGFADHPRVREAAAEAAMRWGVGAGASRLVSGTMTIHERLEQRLAEFEESEAACCSARATWRTSACSRALATPARWSSPTRSTTPRSSTAAVSPAPTRSSTTTAISTTSNGDCARADAGSGVIVTDSVFSMDGDIAPLEEIVELAARHGARVVVDEAHATGALGPGGRGAVAEAGLGEHVDVLVGTLGKALGSYGGYVCARREIVELLLNSARPAIFSTALPPPAVAGALASLELLIEQPLRPQKLQASAEQLRIELAAAGIAVPAGRTQIVPLIVGDAQGCGGADRGGARPRRLRAGDPPADGPRRQLAAAVDGDRFAHRQ